MNAGSCGAVLPGQTDIAFGASYGITATELNKAGYVFNLCYSCDVKEIASSTIITSNKEIKIEALALDCSTSLIDAGFSNPAPIVYNSAGSS